MDVATRVDMRSIFAVAALALAAFAPSLARAADANPSNYLSAVAALKPGETLNLAAGTYDKGLSLNGLNGTASAPITIKGPKAAVFVGRSCCNTVEITNSSYVVLDGFTLDGKNLPDVFGVSAKGGLANFTHHVTVQNLTIVNHGGTQQTVGISTKTPTWGWIIRGNEILGAGTGIYLGNSDGTQAFFDGVVEGNLIKDATGYCMQIKHQLPRPDRAGQPTADSRTIIRHNVFIKNDAPSPDGDRPNLLVDGFPSSGPGSKDRYEIYGNVFVHNPRESLLQAAGRVSIHDNVFVDVTGTAIHLANHKRPLELAYVYNNTIYSAGTGIRFVNAATAGDAVFGNLVFAKTPITGVISKKSDNVEGSVADAASMVKKPSITLSAMDFYPLAGKCTGSALPMTLVTGDVARDVDFNGTAKTPPVYRGAYHGSGENPGWTIGAGKKPLPTSSTTPPADAGPSDGGATSDGGSVADGGSDDAGASGDGGVDPSDGGVDPSDGGVDPSDTSSESDAAPSDPSATPDGDTSADVGCVIGRTSNGALGFVAMAIAAALLSRRRV